ncbi:TPA: Arc family DNA-binding protein [Escherichia coli]|uniref:Arc family DNA-binding protein n=1 Tax=Escherichia coli TaxID=562 RepID=UPI000986E659|nr:Arc family DNA-binding protein [Escherichia coli]EEW9498054.1 Arc family DNA-binding protein [Escherichia coli]EFB1313293.1 Arc family DNA-binding protein [Escherichia coli]EFB3088920.1 Arc family DNA-binding protein [Escherichia coli]EFF9332710.1 Arc family DNA-binding protein [Escherichia coli]EFF9430453.1 Arc family DNA-binding protein [Escherichia coli]
MKGARDISPLGIRIPDYLKKRIQQEADKNGRSMNSEIVLILQKHVDNLDGSRSLEGFANQEADKFKEALLETLKAMYAKDEK